MADNTTLNEGSDGDVIATDDINGVKHQRVKMTLGVDGVNDGDVSKSNPIPTYNPPIVPIDISGVLAQADIAQIVSQANPARQGWWLKNNDPKRSLWVSDVTTAGMNYSSLEIKGGALYESPIGGCSSLEISVIGAIGGQSYTAREW